MATPAKYSLPVPAHAEQSTLGSGFVPVNQWRSHEGAWVGLGPLIYMSGPLRFLIA